MKPLRVIFSLCAIALAAGCKAPPQNPPTAPASLPAAPRPTAVAPATTTTTTVSVTPAGQPFTGVRIKAGPGETFKDADGNVWLPEQGFADGETTERPELKIENTKTPVIYLSEKYSMTGFSYPVPNGKYIVKLHFCETYEGITGPGERVFSFNVQGHEFKDFDIWAKSGGFLRPYIEVVPIEVTTGKVTISFTPQVENPQINGIEILPGN